MYKRLISYLLLGGSLFVVSACSQGNPAGDDPGTPEEPTDDHAQTVVVATAPVVPRPAAAEVRAEAEAPVAPAPIAANDPGNESDASPSGSWIQEANAPYAEAGTTGGAETPDSNTNDPGNESDASPSGSWIQEANAPYPESGTTGGAETPDSNTNDPGNESDASPSGSWIQEANAPYAEADEKAEAEKVVTTKKTRSKEVKQDNTQVPTQQTSVSEKPASKTSQKKEENQAKQGAMEINSKAPVAPAPIATNDPGNESDASPSGSWIQEANAPYAEAEADEKAEKVVTTKKTRSKEVKQDNTQVPTQQTSVSEKPASKTSQKKEENQAKQGAMEINSKTPVAPAPIATNDPGNESDASPSGSWIQEANAPYPESGTTGGAETPDSNTTQLGSADMRKFIQKRMPDFEAATNTFEVGGANKPVFFYKKRNRSPTQRTYIALAHNKEPNDSKACKGGEQSISKVLEEVKSHLESEKDSNEETKLFIPLQQIDREHWTLLEIILGPGTTSENGARTVTATHYDSKSRWSQRKSEYSYLEECLKNHFPEVKVKYEYLSTQSLWDCHNCGRYTLINLDSLINPSGRKLSLEDINQILAGR